MRRMLLVGVLTCMAGGLSYPPLLADELAKELTAEERAKLEQQAKALSDEAFKLYQAGQYAEAIERMEKTLAMRRALYPEARYPQGHPNLAASLSNLGAMLWQMREYDRALPYAEQTLAMYRALYPQAEHPHGHPDLARSLANLGALHREMGEYGRSLPYMEQALAMRQALYPGTKYPQGHPHLAASLGNLGNLLMAMGEYGRARPYAEQTLAMYRALYPQTEHPHGHPNLAGSLTNLASLFESMGEDGRAQPYAEQALAMYRALYPETKYPQGHPDLARSYGNLGVLLKNQREYSQARTYFERALAMNLALYPKEKYPQGHPELAASLTNLGSLFESMGEYDRARSYAEQALAMWRALYPQARYPDGHPTLTRSLSNLGGLLGSMGEYRRALPHTDQALAMFTTHGESLARTESEARALNYVATLAVVRDVYLSIAGHVPESGPASYARVWQTKAAVTRVYERRHLALAAASSPEVHPLWDRLTALRRQRERLLLAPTSRGSPARDQTLEELGQEIARLERKLLPLLPAVERAEKLARSQPGELQEALPAGTVLLDLLRYIHIEQDPKQPGKKGQKQTPRYVAFVVTKDAIHRVELGEAKGIEDAVGQWREAVTAWKGSLPEAGQRAIEERTARQAEAMRQLIWEPVAKHLPVGTHTVYLAPDAALTQVPWPALPGSRPRSVLLEDFALAFVPHGPFLLDKLTAPARPEKRAGALLTLGGVKYDERPAPLSGEPGTQRGGTAHGAEKLTWSPLAGTEVEHQQVEKLARAMALPTTALRSAEAGVNRVLAELPKARYAHLATHGFFADKTFRSVLQLDEKLFERREFDLFLIGERIGEGSRNPLVLSGLVLAGANLPPEQAGPDRGILTADAVLNLLLDDLELVVLSACETGLGDVAGGEGVFGLQRAFHMAGTHNVIASLWKVDDQATAALMTLFYRNLWEKKLPPIEALRQAQLALYRHPAGIAVWAKGERGPDLSKTKPGSASKPAERPQLASGTAPIRQWAAFQLSGVGR